MPMAMDRSRADRRSSSRCRATATVGDRRWRNTEAASSIPVSEWTVSRDRYHASGMDLRPSARQQALIARARRLALERFAPRADTHDRDASFPFDDYADLRADGLLGLCVPECYGGLGADYETYCLVAEQLAQGNASTSLTFNMHCLTMLMMGEVADAMPMPAPVRERHEKLRVIKFPGDWDPMGMRATVSRDMVLQDVFVPDDAEVLPPGLFGAMYNAFPQLSPLTFCATFLGLMQAAYDGALAYLTGAMPGSPGLHTEAAAKGPALAEMLFTLEGTRALYYRAVSEARVDAPAAAVQRARAAVVTVHRSAVVVTQEAIRLCGGRGLLKRYPLERYARDARAGALMRPWTQEIATQQAWETALGLGVAPQRKETP